MTDVASVGSLASMVSLNGPGRESLGLTVARHRTTRAWSRPHMADQHPHLSTGTIQNVETSVRNVRERTLVALDQVFEWEPGTAQAVLMSDAPPPPPPDLTPSRGGGARPVTLPRRLLAEFADVEVHEIRVVELPGGAGRIVMAFVGDPDEPLEAVRKGSVELDNLFRKYHGEEG